MHLIKQYHSGAGYGTFAYDNGTDNQTGSDGDSKYKKGSWKTSNDNSSFYTNISANALRGVLFGGYTYNGDHAGFGCANTINAPSYTSAIVGSRLCFIPES